LFLCLPESLLPDERRSFDWKSANPVGSLLHLKKYPVIAGLTISLFLLHLANQALQSVWNFYTIEKLSWISAQDGYSLGFVGLLVSFVLGG
jgi:DHA1 family tetracycline resistance protein-like MFS transporter